MLLHVVEVIQLSPKWVAIETAGWWSVVLLVHFFSTAFTMSNPTSPESLVLKCLNETEVLLQAALQQLESGLPLNTEIASQADSVTPTDHHEPDDLAAVYFAQQQAKLKGSSSSTKLTIHAWARTIFSTRERLSSGDNHVEAVALKSDVGDDCRRAPPIGADELFGVINAAYGA